MFMGVKLSFKSKLSVICRLVNTSVLIRLDLVRSLMLLIENGLSESTCILLSTMNLS